MPKPAKLINDLRHVSRTIATLRKIIIDPNCAQMNRSNLKGYLGELLVGVKLVEEGLTVVQRGNQAGYDLQFKSIKIDVKCSTLKTEVSNCPPYWGWALKQKSKTKEITCTDFICVALAEPSLEVQAYYVIKAKDLWRFPPSAMMQFKNVEKGCVLLENDSDEEKIARQDIRNYFTICRQLMISGIVRKVEPEESLVHML